MKNFEKELNPWWITMSSLRENSGKKEWSNEMEDEKNKIEALQCLDGSLWW